MAVNTTGFVVFLRRINKNTRASILFLKNKFKNMYIKNCGRSIFDYHVCRVWVIKDVQLEYDKMGMQNILL